MAGEVLGIDVGGSSVKAGLVDLKAGRLAGELIAAPTPCPSTPVAVTNVLAALAGRLPASAGRVGVAFPSVIKEGTAYTAANIDAAWVGTDGVDIRSEEHTSELQSHSDIVCRLLLEKKKTAHLK